MLITALADALNRPLLIKTLKLLPVNNIVQPVQFIVPLFISPPFKPNSMVVPDAKFMVLLLPTVRISLLPNVASPVKVVEPDPFQDKFPFVVQPPMVLPVAFVVMVVEPVDAIPLMVSKPFRV